MAKPAQKTAPDIRASFEDISRDFRAGNLKAAAQKLDGALVQWPDNVNFLHLGGLIRQQCGDIKEADRMLREAHALRPDQPDILHNLAVFFLSTGQPQDAVPLFGQLTQQAPTQAHLWASYGHALRQSGQLKESLPVFAKAQELDAKMNMEDVMAMTRRQLVDWSAPDPAPENIPANLAPVFIRDARAHLVCVKRAAAGIKPVTGFSPRFLTREDGRLRLGYLSNDFHDHATSYLLAELFGLHDRSKFEVFVYAYGRESEAAVTRRMKGAAEHWINCAGKIPAEIARKIYGDNIHILIDLKGYTKGALPEVLAAKPAPLIVSWLGYAGSMGMNAIDYIVADPFIIPDSLRDAYSEKVIRLPHSYQINDRERALLAGKTRRDYGLPDKGAVLCSFNQTYKVTPEIYDVWMRVLVNHADAVLWLYCPDEAAAENFRAEAQKRGVDPARLVFAEKLPQAEHIARYRQADVVLDTYPYGGHTTTSDALWVGAPVAALAGESFASRVSGGLLNAAGLPQLVASSLEEYEVKIRELLADEEKRNEIRRHLQQKRETLPLFDTPAFVRAFESGLEQAFTYYENGKPAEDIMVKP